MSNRTLHNRIAQALAAYRSGSIGIPALRDAVVHNGRALEAMPFALVKEIDDIEYDLTAAQFAEEEDCIADTRGTIEKLERWLNAVPLEGDGA
jgi:hypothetical protein